jgi:hypothetical protein
VRSLTSADYPAATWKGGHLDARFLAYYGPKMRKVPALLAFAAIFLAACQSSAGGARSQAPPPGMDVHLGSPGAQPTEGDSGEGQGGGEIGPTGVAAARVPDVRGEVFEDAVRDLWKRGIDYDLVYARDSSRPLYSVIAVEPNPSAPTPSSGAVNLVLSLHDHTGGLMGTVRCKPEEDELDDPYCLGKLLKY